MSIADLGRVSTGMLVAEDFTDTPLATDGLFSTVGSCVICALRSFSAAAVGTSSRRSVSPKVGVNRWQKYSIPEVAFRLPM